MSSLRRGTHAYAHVTVHFSICALTVSMRLPEMSLIPNQSDAGPKIREDFPRFLAKKLLL